MHGQADSPQLTGFDSLALLLDPDAENVLAVPVTDYAPYHAVGLFKLIPNHSEKERLKEDRRDLVNEPYGEFPTAAPFSDHHKKGQQCRKSRLTLAFLPIRLAWVFWRGTPASPSQASIRSQV